VGVSHFSSTALPLLFCTILAIYYKKQQIAIALS
jgi:hypothetical protein